MNDVRTARRILIKAWVDDPDFKRSYIDNAAVCLMDMQHEREVDGLPFDMGDKETRDEAARRILDWLFPPKELEGPIGPPLTNPPVKRKVFVVEDRCFVRGKGHGVVLGFVQNPHQRLAKVRFDGREFSELLPLAHLEEPR